MSLSRIGLAIVAIVLAVVGVYALFRAFDERAAPPIVIEDAAVDLPIAVEVRGAVAQPGVYELPPGTRVQDAVEAAGGMAPDADSSTINLALRLRDGEVVAIARLPEAGATPEQGSTEAGTSGLINVNTASVPELDALPGIGEVLAQRIVDFREEHGPYRSVDDLIHVQGVSANMIAGFRDQVTTGP